MDALFCRKQFGSVRWTAHTLIACSKSHPAASSLARVLLLPPDLLAACPCALHGCRDIKWLRLDMRTGCDGHVQSSFEFLQGSAQSKV